MLPFTRTLHCLVLVSCLVYVFVYVYILGGWRIFPPSSFIFLPHCSACMNATRTQTHTTDEITTMHGICLWSDIYGFYCLMLHYYIALLGLAWLGLALLSALVWLDASKRILCVCSLHWHNVLLNWLLMASGTMSTKKSDAIILNSCTIDGGRHTLLFPSPFLSIPLCLSHFRIYFSVVVSSRFHPYIYFVVTFTSCLPSLLW